MGIEKVSFCKVNLLLNILGKRPDGFHEVETIMQPLALFDRLELQRAGRGIELTCSDPRLPVDSGNLVYRAAEAFMRTAALSDGVRLRLEKSIPLAAGLGGGSGNAATTLLGLNELFGKPLTVDQLQTIAASLGSDVPFFLQNKPALATGCGEQIQPLQSFPVFQDAAFVLIHPGFGISTPWAYQQLQKFPSALNGLQGRAQRLLEVLQSSDFAATAAGFYNSLEAPALKKYPLLRLFQEFFRATGAAGVLMSGSGSTTFALIKGQAAAELMVEKFRAKFGKTHWVTVVRALS